MCYDHRMKSFEHTMFFRKTLIVTYCMIEVGLQFFKDPIAAHTPTPSAPRLLLSLCSMLGEPSPTRCRSFCSVTELAVKPPRSKRGLTGKSVVNLKAEKAQAASKPWDSWPSFSEAQRGPLNGPTPHHAHWTGGPLITENSISVAKIYRRKHTRKMGI